MSSIPSLLASSSRSEDRHRPRGRSPSDREQAADSAREAAPQARQPPRSRRAVEVGRGPDSHRYSDTLDGEALVRFCLFDGGSTANWSPAHSGITEGVHGQLRKKKTHKVEDIDPSKKGDPKSFVFRRGKHGMVVADLEQDLRRMMLPNTAINLKESKRNVLKDFVSVAGPLGVTHFLILTATDRSTYLKVCKTPRASLARPRVPQNAFKTPPLVVMNNFGGEEHMKLATVLFQNLFPAINVLKTKLAACQRVVLLQFDKETGKISLRHYSIGVAPSGLKKSIKGLVQGKALPDMSDMQDVSEFVSKSGFAS
eukprot:gene6618-3274_t